MKRIHVVLIAAVAFLATLGVPVAANASTTKCSGNFCAHISGTKLHVDYVQMQVTLAPGKSESGTFQIGTPDEPLGARNSYERTTGTYHFSTPSSSGFTVSHLTGDYHLDRSFYNNTRLCVSWYPQGHDEQYVCATIHT